MRAVLLSTASLLAIVGVGVAQAADLPHAPPPPIYSPVAAANWTGFYAGVHGGGGWGDQNPNTPATFSLSGPYIGAQVGYNWQFHNNWLVGIEADGSWSGVHGNRVVPAGTTTESINWFGTVRGRVGYIMGDWMAYVTGGWAWANATRTNSSFGGQTFTANHSGWTAGVGAEWAFAPNWTVKAEYKYLDLGAALYAWPTLPTTASLKLHTVELGLNYKF